MKLTKYPYVTVYGYFPMHKLMVKTHDVTGLKYLCYTRKEGKAYDSYLGSGTEWERHLSLYGEFITTELVYETEDLNEFKEFARNYSYKNNIVESKEWANLRIEEGDGGDTVSNKIWITDGKVDRYHNKDEVIPEGWTRGRSNCVFNDPKIQKEFTSRVDRKKAGKGIKRAWDEGRFNRDHSKCGVRGDQNPAKRSEVKEEISKKNSGRVHYNNGIVTRSFRPGEKIPDGWVKGQLKSAKRSYRWMFHESKGVEKVAIDLLPAYIEQGWQYGRKQK